MKYSDANLKNKKHFSASELPLRADGSVYHLHLLPEHIAQTVILVGDPGRVQLVSSFFDSIEYKIKNREFVTHTGYCKGKRLTVLSTGIGTDNIDIAVNELDAAVNIDTEKRCVKEEMTSLRLIRIGTSGALCPDIPVGSFVISRYGMGLDNLNLYYRFEQSEEELKFRTAFMQHSGWNQKGPFPYFTKGSEELISLLEEGMHKGITATAPGFYGPQGRRLRLPHARSDLLDVLGKFKYAGERIINFEMETSALYGIGRALGHACCTCCAVIANRFTCDFIKDHDKPVRQLIGTVLQRIIHAC